MDIGRLRPFILTASIVAADQITKAVVAARIPLNTVGVSFWGGFFRIVHVGNTGVAFSMGRSWPDPVKRVLFIVIPLAVLVFLAVYLVRSKDLTRAQRWILAGICGGGLGNLVDRIFRGGRVVDFLDFRFYGLFGLERWPSFNIADASIVVSGILLILSMIIMEIRARKGPRSDA